MHLSAFFLKVIFLSAQLVVCKMFWLTLRARGKWISLSDVLERSLILQLHSTYCLHCRSDCTRWSHNGIEALICNFPLLRFHENFCLFLEELWRIRKYLVKLQLQGYIFINFEMRLNIALGPITSPDELSSQMKWRG